MKKHLSTLAIALIASAIVHAGVQWLLPARADQSERIVPTSGIFSGPQYAQLIGDMARSISTANKGSTAPANVSGVAVDGLEWLDDSAEPWVKKRYVNGGWAPEAAFDPTTSTHIGYIGGGTNSIASASIVDLGAVNEANVTITGTTTISGFGSSAPTGIVKIVRFAAALSLTYSSALPVPCGVSLVTAANDRAIVTHLGSGNWEITSYQRASGVPVDCSAVGKIDYGMFASVPANHVAGYGQAISRASYPAYLAAVTRAQNGTRSSGNATISSVANTAGLGAGMPVEGTGINAGCTIASVTSSSITLNSSSCVTSSGTSTVTVFITGYGTGGSSSTVGVPECRNRFLAGRDRDDPGSFVSLLTSSYFGADGKIFNVAGGSQSRTLSTPNLPPYTPTGSVPLDTTNHVSARFLRSGGVVVTGGGGGSALDGAQPGTATLETLTASFSGDAQGGSSAAFAIVPPSLVAECVVRVTP